MVDLNALLLPRLFELLVADGCLDRLLTAAIEEDVRPPGDITSACIVDAEEDASGRVVARQGGTIAGLAALSFIVKRADSITIDPVLSDGECCRAGQTIARVAGNLRSILRVERILLNLLGRLSGVATLARQFGEAIAGTNAVTCDTRKTTPGLRNLEKYAVRCGGGTLHRLGLYDAALFKDNHLAGIPGEELTERLTRAIESLRARHHVRFVEVEADSLEQLRHVLSLRSGLVDIVLLDNMTVEQLRKAVSMRNDMGRGVLLEASGGITLHNVRSIAETGVDRISVGAITHSAAMLDIGLDIDA